jgi:membrane-bound lytic murein transglycosylase D
MKWLCACVLLLAGQSSIAAEEILPRPVELQPDVDFWIRVYSEITTNEGFIHDQRNLAVVYETIHFAPAATPRERQSEVDTARERYQRALRALATGAAPEDAEALRVRDLWGATTPPARLAQAVDDVRFQLGQSDRFRAGLMRAGAWEPHITATIAALGLPPEIAALPHVESSFDPEAYSKVGAAGLWQFMRSTGRRFMRIDTAVDERMDPFRATEAAAQLMAYNYRVLGTWPLAITAYNHGAEGMRRARDSLGTSDIVRILREYNSPLFGFASRNFYVSFLAALTIDRDPAKYFGAIKTQPAAKFQEIPLSTAASMAAIERVVGLPRTGLRALNPALRELVWSGARPVPAGYRLRLPAAGDVWSKELLAAKLGREAPAIVAQVTPAAEQQAVAAEVSEASAEQARVSKAAAAKPAEPVSVVQAADQGPTLVPGAAASLSADAVDLAVADNGTIRIAAAETLGHYADWLGLSAAHLRTLNDMGFRTPVLIGRRLKLDFTHVDRAQFEQRRRDYHQRMQAEYFAANRIVGTEVYLTRRGDSLWSVTQRTAGMPTWLVQQYNPDVDFSALRPGTQIVLPRIEVRPDV